MSANVITIDKGQPLVVQVHDRSFGGGTTPLIEIDEIFLNIRTTGGLTVKGVPLGSLPAGNPTPTSSIQLTSDRADSLSAGPEEWLREWTPDLSALSGTVRCRLSGVAVGPGTYSVRLGGTSGGADGQVIATLVVSSTAAGGSLVQVVGVPFANLGGSRLVKLTGSTPSNASLRSVSVLLEST